MSAPANSFQTKTTLRGSDRDFSIWSLGVLIEAGFGAVRTLPFSLKVLLENLLRREDGRTVKRADLEALLEWDPMGKPAHEIALLDSATLPRC